MDTWLVPEFVSCPLFALLEVENWESLNVFAPLTDTWWPNVVVGVCLGLALHAPLRVTVRTLCDVFVAVIDAGVVVDQDLRSLFKVITP